ADDQATWALELGDFARARSFYLESLKRARALESDATIGSSLLGLGLLALAEQRDDEEVPLFTESLVRFLRPGRRVDVPQSLRGLATAAFRRDDLATAARLLGAAEVMEEK